MNYVALSEICCLFLRRVAFALRLFFFSHYRLYKTAFFILKKPSYCSVQSGHTCKSSRYRPLINAFVDSQMPARTGFVSCQMQIPHYVILLSNARMEGGGGGGGGDGRTWKWRECRCS